jgi:adenylate cyclase
MKSRNWPLALVLPLLVLAAAFAVLAGDLGHIASASRTVLSHFYGVPLIHPAWTPIAELAFLAVASAGFLLLAARFGIFWAALPISAAIFVAGAISWRLYADGVLFDAVGPGLAVVLTMATAAAGRTFDARGTRSRLLTAFADALPPETIETLVRAPELLKLEGERRTVTYLSCGILGLPVLAASLKEEPAQFTRLVESVLVPLIDEALAQGGTIERMTSDGFGAFWNAPLDDDLHAMHACEAAIQMTGKFAQANQRMARERLGDDVAAAPVEIGIGIVTGPVIAGGYRAHRRIAYGVTGDCAILADRLRTLSAQYGMRTIVAESTRENVLGFAFLEVDTIAPDVGGEPVRLFAMLGDPVMRAGPKFRALSTFHEQIFEAFRARQWQQTRVLIEQCRRLSGASQKLYDLHLARVAHFEENPPDADWDGSFHPGIERV